MNALDTIAGRKVLSEMSKRIRLYEEKLEALDERIAEDRETLKTLAERLDFHEGRCFVADGKKL